MKIISIERLRDTNLVDVEIDGCQKQFKENSNK